MISFQERYKDNTFKERGQLASHDVAYFRQRFKNVIFQEVMNTFAKRAESDGMTKADIAQRLGKDRAIISRIFAGPKNWTLDTISDIALALNTEPEFSLESLDENPRHNYVHPWMAEMLVQRITINHEQAMTSSSSTINSVEFVRVDNQ